MGSCLGWFCTVGISGCNAKCFIYISVCAVLHENVNHQGAFFVRRTWKFAHLRDFCVFWDLRLRPIGLDGLFLNTSIWPTVSHTFHYFQTDSEAGIKDIGVVKTWHSQKRAAGPRDYPETSHMTQSCRNYSNARVPDEGPLEDIVWLSAISVLLPRYHRCLSYDPHPLLLFLVNFVFNSLS